MLLSSKYWYVPNDSWKQKKIIRHDKLIKSWTPSWGKLEKKISYLDVS